MSTVRKVRLGGGHFDGQTIEVDVTRTMITLDWEDKIVDRDWDGRIIRVSVRDTATYVRVEPDLFEYRANGPLAIGDAERMMRGDR